MSKCVGGQINAFTAEEVSSHNSITQQYHAHKTIPLQKSPTRDCVGDSVIAVC